MIIMMMTTGACRRTGYANPMWIKLNGYNSGKTTNTTAAHDSQTKQITTLTQLIVAYTCTYPTRSRYGNAPIFQCIEHEDEEQRRDWIHITHTHTHTPFGTRNGISFHLVKNNETQHHKFRLSISKFIWKFNFIFKAFVAFFRCVRCERWDGIWLIMFKFSRSLSPSPVFSSKRCVAQGIRNKETLEGWSGATSVKMRIVLLANEEQSIDCRNHDERMMKTSQPTNKSESNNTHTHTLRIKRD